jgi:hypothetical protein
MSWSPKDETLDDARRGIRGYVDRYHQRPHSSLNYRTPLEVRQTWEDLRETLFGSGRPTMGRSRSSERPASLDRGKKRLCSGVW